MVPERNIPNPLVARYPHLLLLTTNFLIYLLMNLSDRKEYLFKTAKYINPPLSVVFLLQPKGDYPFLSGTAKNWEQKNRTCFHKSGEEWLRGQVLIQS